MAEKIYKLKYQFLMEHGEFKKEDAGPEHGLCDKFIFVSILANSDGSTSTAVIGKDATSGELKDAEPLELFKAWVLLAKQLSDKLPATSWQQVVSENTFNIVRDILRGKNGGGKSQDSGSGGDSKQ